MKLTHFVSQATQIACAKCFFDTKLAYLDFISKWQKYSWQCGEGGKDRKSLKVFCDITVSWSHEQLSNFMNLFNVIVHYFVSKAHLLALTDFVS